MRKLTLADALNVARVGFAKRAQILGSPVGYDDDPKRACGECRACCSALDIQHSPGEEMFGIVVVEADSGVACPHECAQGCAVYDRRPASCQLYSCWWRRGWSPDGARPDKLRLTVDDSLEPETFEIGAPVCCASEIRAGVFAPKDSPLEQQPPLIRSLQEDRLVMMRYWGDGHPSRVYGPPAMLKKLRDAEVRLGYRPADA